MEKISNPDVATVFQSYPDDIRQKLMFVRQLIVDVASEYPAIGDLEETLKWGEPSYLVKGGSTVRIGWKESRPVQYGVYFNCNTTLVDTFKEVYSELFHFEGNRAIIFDQHDTIPIEPLRHCIALALQYHKIKHLPLLGV